MIAEIMQAMTDVVKTSSYFTGQFVIDGALLIAGLKTVEVIIGKVKKRNGMGLKPGQGETCREHGEAIAGLNQFKETATESLGKIDRKLDRLIEKFIGKP